MNLADVIEGLVEERGLDREKIVSVICDGMKAAYVKKFPQINFVVSFNKKSGTLDVFSEKKVVASVVDDENEISLRKARSIDPDAQLDAIINVPFEHNIGRIEILMVKQMISSKIREIESLAVYSDFKDKLGSILTGVVHKRERNGLAIKIGEVTALLPKDGSIPNEILKVGHPVKVLLKEVLSVPRWDYQLILDRASCDFIRGLIEIEIPEVFEGLVEIKKIVRAPGYKTKAILASNSKDIDPVGTCVGVGGARIKPILRELGQEKIDLIEATDSIEDLVRNSLKPAEIDKVEVVDDWKAIVWLAQDQRSYAIGKMGQNISLASKLVGLDIQLQDVNPLGREISREHDKEILEQDSVQGGDEES